MATRLRSPFCSRTILALRSRLDGLTLKRLQGRPIPELEQTDEYNARSKRTAAIFVPLCNVGGDASVLFTTRSQHVGSHKGQVSFPGGHVDPGEQPHEAALRELGEEVSGFGSSAPEVIGDWHAVRAITGTWCQPVVGIVRDDLDELPSFPTARTREVSEVFSITVADLMDPSKRGTQNLGSRGEAMPVFYSGPTEVWGLTAFILDGVLRDVVLPAMEEAATGGA